MAQPKNGSTAVSRIGNPLPLRSADWQSAIRSADWQSAVSRIGNPPPLPAADCQSAIRQVGNLRYSA